MYMIITDLFDIDIHIFTVIKFLFNLVVKFKYINLLRSKELSIFVEYESKNFLTSTFYESIYK